MNYGLWNLAMRGRRKAFKKYKRERYNNTRYSKRNYRGKNQLSFKDKYLLWYLNYLEKKIRKLSRRCSYNAYLQTNHWKWVTSEAKKFNNNRCQICGAVATETHHLTYNHIGSESMNEILVLCHDCHFKKIHNDIPASRDYNNAYIARGNELAISIKKKRISKDIEILQLKEKIAKQQELLQKQMDLLQEQHKFMKKKVTL